MILHPTAEPVNAPAFFRAHLPADLDLREILQKHNRLQWLCYAQWVVSAVVFYRYTHRDTGPEDFIPLDKQVMDRHMPGKIRRELLDILENEKVLDCDDEYFFGGSRRGKCYCWRVGEPYRRSNIKPTIVTHRELMKKIDHARELAREEVKDPTHKALRDWHNRVEVLPEAAGEDDPLLNVMLDGERRFKVDDYGRIHTNITNLARQHRKYVRLGGKVLSSVDVATSQPLLLAVLLSARKLDSNHTKERNRKGREGGEKGTVLLAPSYYPCLSNVYLDDCLTGVVYDRLGSHVELSEGRSLTRDDVKGLFLAVIYGRADHMHTTVGRAIRALYPDVFDRVLRLNLEHGVGWLPCRLQAIESDVMIRGAAARVLRERPDIPLLTQHDSLICPPEYAEYVRDAIAEEWGRKFGIVPSLKLSEWTAPQAPRQTTRKRRRKQRRAGLYERLETAIGAQN